MSKTFWQKLSDSKKTKKVVEEVAKPKSTKNTITVKDIVLE